MLSVCYELTFATLVQSAVSGSGRGIVRIASEKTICKFYNRLERPNLGDRLFALIAEYPHENGMKVNTDTIMDAINISAPISTKNKNWKRDSDMHRTKKGSQWYFGMKAHIGMNSRCKLIRSVRATAANVHYSQILPDLLHGGGTCIRGDSAYAGQIELIRKHVPRATDFTQEKGHRLQALSDTELAKNHTKSRLPARVEHPLLILKRVFGFEKVRYRGLDKNAN